MEEHWQVCVKRNHRRLGEQKRGLIVSGNIEAWLAAQGARKTKTGHYTAGGWRLYVWPVSPEVLACIAALLGPQSAAAQALAAQAA